MVHKKSHAQYFALFMLQIKTVFRPRMGECAFGVLVSLADCGVGFYVNCQIIAVSIMIE